MIQSFNKSATVMLGPPAQKTGTTSDGDVVVVLFDNSRRGRILAVRDTGDSFEGFSIRPVSPWPWMNFRPARR